MFNRLKKNIHKKKTTSEFQSESNLIQSFIEGDSKAFKEIYELHKDTVSHQISRQIQDPAAADDLTQEVFLKAHRFRSTFRPGTAFQSWIRVIARNTVFDWLRKHASEAARISSPLTYEDNSPAASWEELPSEQPCAESLVIRKSERRKLRNALRSLTRMQRRVLWLSVIHQLPYAEIARTLGVSVASVKCLAYRARSVLSEGLTLNATSPAMA